MQLEQGIEIFLYSFQMLSDGILSCQVYACQNIPKGICEHV